MSRQSLTAAAALTTALWLTPTLAPAQDVDPASPDSLASLFERAGTGAIDQHLPYQLFRLRAVLAGGDAIAFFDLVDPGYFREQFGFLSENGATPGVVMRQFTCEFFQVCDVSKDYEMKDIVDFKVNRIFDRGSQTEIKLELEMTDGLVIPATIYYDEKSRLFLSASG